MSAATAICLALAGITDALIRHELGITGDAPFYVRVAAHPAGRTASPTPIGSPFRGWFT
jgi:hypothetical protein